MAPPGAVAQQSTQQASTDLHSDILRYLINKTKD